MNITLLASTQISDFMFSRS